MIWADLFSSRKVRFIFDQGLVDVTYNNLAFQGHSDFYRRTFARTFGFGIYYTISQLMSRLGALRESDFDLHVQQYKTNERFSLLSVRIERICQKEKDILDYFIL